MGRGGRIIFGDGSQAKVIGKGQIDILGIEVSQKALYVEGLKANLLSISQLCDDDLAVQFSKKECNIVSILALFCVWTKSLMCNDAANRDSTFQSEVRRISKFPVSRPDDVSSRLDAHLSTVPSVWTTCHSVRTSDRQASSVRTMCFFRLDTYIVSRSFCASLLRPDLSAARPDAYQFSNGSLILSKFKKGKINQSSGRCGISSGHVSL
jgi:SET domain-containing protein